MKQMIQPINLPKLTTLELNILGYFLYKLHNTSEKGIVIELKEIKQINKNKNITKQALLNTLEVIHEKVMDYKCELHKIFKDFTIFESPIGTLSHVILVKNNDHIEILEQLMSNFSEQYLTIFLNLKSKYSKLLYLLFKQFKNKRKITIFKNDFKNFQTYMKINENMSMSYMDDRILKPSIKELSNIYANLHYVKHKDKRYKGQGGKVVGITFSFENNKGENNE